VDAATSPRLGKPPDASQVLAALGRAGLGSDRSRPILLVDDDPNALKFAELELQAKGYVVVCGRDAATALDTLDERQPAAIILDLVMEGMDGTEFLARLRQRPNGREVPVIIWTQKDLSQEEREALLAQAQALVLKDEGAKPLLDHLSYHVAAPRRAGGEAL
jgi:CheY-like chemotaxis protein